MSYVTQTNFTGTVSSILKTIQDLDNHIAEQLGIMNKHIDNNTTKVDYILNDPQKGINAINAGLAEAYKDSQAHYSNEVDLAKWIGEIIVKNNLANPRAGTWNPQTGSFNPNLTPVSNGSNDPLAWLKSLGLGLGLGSGAVLVGAGILALLAIRGVAR